MRPIRYNNHVHVFTMRCAPGGFLRSYGVPGFVIKRLWPLLKNRTIARMLQEWIGSMDNRYDSLIRRYLEFARIGLHKNQLMLFEELIDQYSEDFAYVVLTLNMDHMGAGKPSLSYHEQLHHLKVIRKRHPDSFLPFYSIDPRAGSPEELLDNLRHYVEQEAYVGIKLYPSLGFWPFDRRLDPVWEYAVEHRLPLLTHADTGGINYVGEWKKEHLNPSGFEPEEWPSKFDRLEFPFEPGDRKLKDACDDFVHPFAYARLLERFPELKLCFAHAGGVPHVLEEAKSSSWFSMICYLMERFPNVHTDVSYTLHDSRVFKPLRKLIDGSLGDRVLFGTDYFMTTREKPESTLVREFRDSLRGNPRHWEKVSQDSVARWLSSSHYQF